ncbi:MAG: tandem-95 repeat protein [Euryarchaeota archaeon]|nr:tandem-95 repeat protein [Euryarchaeota archaeon]
MSARTAILACVTMVLSTCIVAVPVAACHNQTNTCNEGSWTDNNMSPNVIDLNTQGNPTGPNAITVAPGEKAYFNSTMSLSPGCGSSYFLYATMSAVPAGWKATYTTDPNGAGTDLSNIDNQAWGNGNVVVRAYLVVTAPMQCMEGDTVTITTMLGADDNARNDKDLVYAKCTVKIHIPHPSPEIAKPVSPFSIKEDTVDDSTINLTSVFRNVDGDPMLFGVQPNSNIVPSVYQTGRVVLKPKPDWNGAETLTFTARDALSAYVTSSVIVTVTPVPDDPVLAAPMKDFAIPQDGQDDGSINLNKVFFDADTPYGDRLLYACAGQDKIAVTIKPDGKVNFKPLAGWYGEETVNFTATDDRQVTVSDDVKVTVTNNAKPPFVQNPIRPVTFPEDTIDESIDLSTVFASPMYGVVLIFGAEPSSHFNVTVSASGKVTLEPRKYWHGTETLSFSASDGMFAPVYADALVTVTHVNHQPFQVRPLELAFEEDTASPTVYLDQYFADNDGDKLSYSMSSTTNLTVTIYLRTAELHITPALNYNGESTLTLKVTDGLTDLAVKVPVTVSATDDPPIITDPSPPANVFCTEGDELTFSVGALDIDGDAIGSIWEIDQNFTPFEKFTGKLSAKFRAAKEMGAGVGTHTLSIWVDGAERSSTRHSWQITVLQGNRPPSVPTIKTPQEGQTFTTKSDIQFDVFAEDLDLDPMTFKWFIDGKEASALQAFSTRLEAGTHVVKVTVTDEHGLSATSPELSITVNKPPPTPSKSNTPGFELVGLLAALGAAMVLLRKRK